MASRQPRATGYVLPNVTLNCLLATHDALELQAVGIFGTAIRCLFEKKKSLRGIGYCQANSPVLGTIKAAVAKPLNNSPSLTLQQSAQKARQPFAAPAAAAAAENREGKSLFLPFSSGSF